MTHNYQLILAQCSIVIPPENVKKPKVSDVFRGFRNGTLGYNGLTLIINFVPMFHFISIRSSICNILESITISDIDYNKPFKQNAKKWPNIF